MAGGVLDEERFEALIVEARDGREWALAELWRAYQPRLRGYLGALDQAAADDLCSDTWVSVAQALGRFRGSEADFRSWLFTIAHRRLADHRRQRARRCSVPLSTATPLGDSRSAESAAVEGEGTRRALELIAALPPDQAQVVLLRSVAGLAATEVANVLGKRPGAVRVLAHRGLRTLARTLGQAQAVGPAVELDGAR